MRILIADDEAFVVEGLTLLLHQNLPQVEIMTADNGRSALAVLRERGGGARSAHHRSEHAAHGRH